MPSDDPYAKYLTPPSAPSSSSASAPDDSSDPYSKYLSKPGSQPASAPDPSSGGWGEWLTSPKFMNESYLQEAKDIGLSGADSLMLGQLKHIAPQSVGDAISQAHQNLGLADYGLSAATYMIPGIGPGRLVGAAARGAVDAVPLLAKLSPAITEGAIAGGISNFDPNNPVSSTLGGAAGGSLVGGAAAGLTKVAGKIAAGKVPQFDPDAAVAATKQIRDQAYAPLKGYNFDPNDVYGAHINTNLTPGMQADVSPGMDGMLKRQRQAILSGGTTANDIADYSANLRAAGNAPGASNGDQLLANQTAGNLEGLLARGQPITGQTPGEAAQMLSDAKTAHSQYMNAQALQQLQTQLRDFGQGPGRVPQQQIAAGGYQPGSPQYQAWANIAQAGRPGIDPSYTVGHLAGETAEVAALATLGPWAMLPAKALAYLGAKTASKKLMSGMGSSALQKAYQAGYPDLTGAIAPPRGTLSPGVGDAIKNLMIGGAY